jgi:pyridoxamine 5'-phosphate oxidase
MTNPISQFSEWLADAKARKDILEPTAMSLATVGEGGQPSVRIVLLKAHDERGFVFYTNLTSRKSRELIANPKASLCFYWGPLERQVRIEGVAEPVSDVEADAYFASRPLESQLGAWVSKQSEPLESFSELLQQIKDAEGLYDGRPVPRPPHWSGWRIVPDKIEFWQQGAFRIHDRKLYGRDGDAWSATGLYP